MPVNVKTSRSEQCQHRFGWRYKYRATLDMLHYIA